MDLHKAIEQAYKNGYQQAVKDYMEKETAMVSCTNCIHYKACERLVDHLNKIVEMFNSMTDSKLDGFSFPLVAETKEILCVNYEKAKVK